MTTRKRITRPEMMKTGLRRRSRQASDHRERGLPEGPEPSGRPASRVVASLTARSIAPPIPVPAIAPSGCWGSGIADPGVEDGVQQVDEQVGHQEHQDEDGHEADHGLGVLAQDALVELVADAMDVEDALGDDRA